MGLQWLLGSSTIFGHLDPLGYVSALRAGHGKGIDVCVELGMTPLPASPSHGHSEPRDIKGLIGAPSKGGPLFPPKYQEAPPGPIAAKSPRSPHWGL